MRRRAPHIPLRRLIYVGCEGKSEANYAGFLQDLCRDAGLPVHLVIDELAPGAGDPLDRIAMAVRRLGQLRKKREAPEKRFALLDSDQAERDPERAERARRLAEANGISIVWQHPCFEAVILRHLEGKAGQRPPDTPGSEKALGKIWPAYAKPMPRAALGAKFDLTALSRVANVEPELKAMLICIGLIAAA